MSGRRRGAVTIGVFDGLHRGHRGILNLLIREARRLKAVPTVITFDRHPLETLRPARAPRMIMSLSQRLAALRNAGVDRIHVLRFDRRCAAVSAAEFLEKILWRRLHPVVIVVGPNFAFGRGGIGNLLLLRRWGRLRGVRILLASSVSRGGRSSGRPAVISSSLIRRLLSRGDVSAATRLLGHPFDIAGRVVRGAGRGGRWGIPTANLSPEIRYALPSGVYAGLACVRTGSPRRPPAPRWTRAVINIGTHPTISARLRRGRPLWPASHSGRPAVAVEVHLLGLRRNLYGRHLHVRLLKRLRAERKFPSPESLVRQIRRDIASARTMKI